MATDAIEEKIEDIQNKLKNLMPEICDKLQCLETYKSPENLRLFKMMLSIDDNIDFYYSQMLIESKIQDISKKNNKILKVYFHQLVDVIKKN